MRQRALVAVLISVVFAGCSSRKDDAVAYAKAHALGLLRAAQSLRGGSPGPLSESEYPPEIRALNPASVAVNERGVYVYIHSSPLYVTGIFIRLDPRFAPPAPVPDSDARGYEPVSGEVFWFSQPR